MSTTEAWASLDDALYGGDQEIDYDLPAPELPDAEAVNRALGRLARVRRRAAADREVAEAQIAQVRQWLAERDRLNGRAEAWYLTQLRGYHEALLAEDPTRKTVGLPAGTLRARAGQPGLDVDEGFVEWAREHRADLTRVKVELDRRALRDAVVKNGEAFDGVTVTPAVVSFTVDTQGDDA